MIYYNISGSDPQAPRYHTVGFVTQPYFLLTSHKYIDNVYSNINLDRFPFFNLFPRNSGGIMQLDEENVIALSSTEEKYIAEMHAAKKALWLRW